MGLEWFSLYLALGCSFLMGLGDACVNTAIYAILQERYPQRSIQAFALFKFFQSASAAVSFFYSSTFSLTVMLLINAAFLFLGSVGYIVVMRRPIEGARPAYGRI